MKAQTASRQWTSLAASGMKKGQVFMSFLGEIKKIVEEAKKTAGMEKLVEKFEAIFGRYNEVALTISKAAGSDKGSQRLHLCPSFP